jgi:hypothetical protein
LWFHSSIGIHVQSSPGGSNGGGKPNNIGISSFFPDYEDERQQPKLDSQPVNDQLDFQFRRGQSPGSIQQALACCKRRRPFKYYQGKDGRHGFVSCTKLDGSWVLAESRQTAVNCTAEQVLEAYLSGTLQQTWNADKVVGCVFKEHQQQDGSSYYQQDLTLKSIRVITSHTGIMKYSQIIHVDKILSKDHQYTVSVRMLDRPSTTKAKPFEALDVYVSLKQQLNDVEIYAAGIMQVNRKVVPNLVVFDASGIAGNLAGKGTLWLAAYFKEQSRK